MINPAIEKTNIIKVKNISMPVTTAGIIIITSAFRDCTLYISEMPCARIKMNQQKKTKERNT